MNQKTLTKMRKYAKMKGWRFGQLIINTIAAGEAMPAVFYIEDKELEKRFNKLWETDKPIKDRGGYYPHGRNTKTFHP